jgi:hypothetical protein
MYSRRLHSTLCVEFGTNITDNDQRSIPFNRNQAATDTLDDTTCVCFFNLYDSYVEYAWIEDAKQVPGKFQVATIFIKCYHVIKLTAIISSSLVEIDASADAPSDLSTINNRHVEAACRIIRKRTCPRHCRYVSKSLVFHGHVPIHEPLGRRRLYSRCLRKTRLDTEIADGKAKLTGYRRISAFRAHKKGHIRRSKSYGRGKSASYGDNATANNTFRTRPCKVARVLRNA